METPLIVNLIDNDFRHIQCSTHGKISKNISYVRDLNNWPGITIFTNDFCINLNAINSVNSKIKIAWLLEPRSIKTHIYDNIHIYEDYFDYIITYDKDLLQRNKKYVFAPFGGSWIEEKNFGLHKKCKNVSMIFSEKNFAPGHNMRHKIYNNYKNNNLIDFYGKGCDKKIEKKEEALIDYQYSIIIENENTTNFFTEKLIDCFITGTVPIYWGCNNIDKFFNKQSILQFNSIEDLQNILMNINFDEFYEKNISSIKENIEESKKYEITEDWIYSNFIKGL